MTTLVQDLRYATRAFASSPGFFAAAVLSLALGIGANTAIFSVANALLLHPLPYADASRLVILWNRSPGLNIAQDWFSTAQYFDIKTEHSAFEEVAIALGANYNLTGDGEPERVGVIQISANLLPMLGARPALGRLFVADEDRPGRTATAVLGYGTWVRRYGGDPGVVGKSITLNGRPYDIVGVLPERFALPREVLPTLGVADDGEIFLPLPLAPTAAGIRTREDFNVIGRLKPGVSVAHAQVEMDTITARLRRDYPEIYPPTGGLTFSIVPLRDQVVGDVRPALLVLVGSVGFVLLVACANVANLLLCRALGRQKEIAVRAALGATRARIGRQLLTESVLLALCGGAAGGVLALGGVKWIQVLQPRNIPRLREIGVNGEVLLFTLLLSLCAGILFGLAPALSVRRVDLYTTLKDANRGSAGTNAVGGRGHSVRRLLVISELALSVVLLVGAGLLIRSFARVQTVEPGFNTTGVLTLELTMSGRKYGDGQTVLNTYHDLWQRLSQLPSVRATGGVTSLPLSGYFSWGPITVEGRPPPAGEEFINADERVVGGDYFRAMEIPILRGRLFDDRDAATSPRVMIVDDFMAQQFWPHEDPIGKRIHLGALTSTSPWQTVVGVVGRVKQYGLDSDGRIAIYLPHTQSPSRAMYVVVRSYADPAALTSAVKKVIGDLDPDLPAYRIQTMAYRVHESMARRRFSMVLLTLFASLALALATIGMYGVTAYLVSQGAREIGIRIALGATERGIMSLVLRQGMTPALFGVAIGLAGAQALTHVIRTLLFGSGTTDPLTFSIVALTLVAIALVASYLPARRAARIDPVVSLRNE